MYYMFKRKEVNMLILNQNQLKEIADNINKGLSVQFPYTTLAQYNSYIKQIEEYMSNNKTHNQKYKSITIKADTERHNY